MGAEKLWELLQILVHAPAVMLQLENLVANFPIRVES